MSDIDSFLDGVAPAAQSESQIDSFLGPEKSSTARRVLGDGGVSVMKGLARVPESLVGIADIAAGGRVGKAVEDAGVDFKGAQDYWGDMYSPEQKLANENVAEADGFVDKLGAIADNPSVIPHAVIESVPAMFAGGFIGKGVKALPIIGKGVSSLAAGAIGEGAIMGGGAAESMRQQTEDGLITDKQQLAALGTSVVGGALGFGGAALGKKLGFGDIDTAIVDGTLGTSARSMPARIAGGAAVEGLLQEMPQSGAETALENYAMDRPLDQGVGGAMAMGAVTGTAMGGAFGAMSGRGEQPAAEPVPEADPVAEMAPAVDLVQPTPTPENPAPAPVVRPDPNAGPLSAAASLLPAATPVPVAAAPLAEVAPLLGEQVNPATGEVMQQPAPAAILDAGQPVADQQAKSASLIERGRAAREQAAQEVPPEMLQDQLASLQGEPAVKESVPKKAAKKRALKKAAKAAETEEQLREQLTAIEKHARGNGGWNTNTSKVRAELRTKLDAFDSAKPVAAMPPAVDADKVDPIQGQDIDGDWASFSESSGTLNVPRAQMPQIKAEHRGAMVNFLNARGVTHEEQTVPATSLKPTQAEFSREKVAKAKGHEGGDRSILVSSDGHVLDGHHQWLAKREAGDDVKVIRLGAPISDLLGTVAEFPSATKAEGATEAPTEDAAPDTAVAENTTAIAADPVAEQPVADPVPAKKPTFISKAQADHLFGTDKKREAALERIASGKAWFLSESRAKAFVKENGLADTHAVMQDNKRFVIDVKPDPDGWQPVFGFGSKGRKEILQAVVDMRRENPAMEFRTVNEGDNLAIQSRKAPVVAEANEPVVSQKVTTDEKTEAEPKPEPTQKAAESQFAGNKVFTADAVEKARARMKSKLGQLNSGIDPELMMDGMTIAGAYIESGMRSFAQYAKAMVDDMGDGVKPYLLSFWEAARHFPGVDKEGMTSVEESARLHAELNATIIKEAGGQSQKASPAQEDKRNEQPATGNADQGRAQAVRGAGSAPQQGTASADPVDVAPNQPADGGTPDQAGDTGRPGLRLPGADVAAEGRIPQGRDAGNGREGAGRARAPDAGAGGNAGAGISLGNAALTSPAAASELAQDLLIANPLEIVGGTPVQRFNRNRAALELLQSLEEEGRQATPEEQKTLAGYIGWGSFGQELFQGSWDRPIYRDEGIWKTRGEWLRETLGESAWKSAQRSITNAHYTDPPTVMAMWDMVKRMGFTGGKIQEPSMGTGNFYSMMPADIKARSQLTGIELDETTGAIAKQLFPKSNIRVMGYEQSKTPDGFYDLIIGNWPFENTPVADRRYNKLNPMLHDYFFLKTLDQVRAGGIVIGITSAGSMDKQNTLIRRELARNAELVAAIRLPSGAFQEYAGTKVVTDIVVLRKRPERLAAVPGDATWTETTEVDTPSGKKVRVNQYFAENPEHIIGTLDFGSGTTTFQAGMIVHRPENMAERLQQAVDLVPAGAFKQATTTDHITYYANATGERHGALADSGGKLMIAVGDQMIDANEKLKYQLKDEKKTAAREAELREAIELRKLHTALVDADRQNKDAEPARKALREAYNSFTKAYGPLRDSFAVGYMDRINDPFHAELAALENDDGKPATVMSRSTTRGRVQIESPGVRDAYVLARNQSVNPSIDEIAKISGKSAEAVKAELLESGAVFSAPNGDIVPSDIYLSGNVREKMREAEAGLAEGNKEMSVNIEALKAVMPEDVPYFNIETKLGATWVSPEHYAGYIAHMLSRDNTDGIEVAFKSGRWDARISNSLSSLPEARTNYGTGVVSFGRLVQAAMSNQSMRLKSKDIDGTDYYDAAKSEEANARISKIRDEFGTWLWSDAERRVDMEREYNEARNAWATPKYDGSFLTFEGMALSLGTGQFQLRQHQVNAIWRAIVNRRSLNAHEVGTGKTFTMGGIAIESRRYGIAKKPVILAHNANSASVAAEIRMMYPNARVLYIDNLEPSVRAVRMRQIANDDWDAIVIPHSLIDRLSLREETLMQMAADDIASLEAEFFDAAAEDGVDVSKVDLDDEKSIEKIRSVTAKELAKARKRIIENIKKQSQASSKEGAIAFEDLGIDMILVDEVHEFKKPPIVTRMQMKGLNTSVSNRSIALQFLTRYVRQMNNGGNVHTFTGTPITNTITEIYHQMRYVMESEMAQANVADWDGWFGSFATEVSDVELTAAGEYEIATRLAGFVNVPELRQMVGQYMDTVFAEDMPEMQPRRTKSGKQLTDEGITDSERTELLNGRTEGAQDRPYKQVINASADMSEQQITTFQRLQKLAREWRDASGKQRKEWSSSGDPHAPIVAGGIADKASFDARLIDDSMAGMEGKTSDDPTSKASRAVANVLEIYKSHPLAGQVIFSDMGFNKVVERSKKVGDERIKYKVPVLSTMQDIVERLVQGGIPRAEIAMVTGATKKEQRHAIAKAMNTGAIRVVLGSTDTLGVGVNMQRNLRAMHHLDAPHMPGELEQRNGRGLRQGNQWNTVLEYRYMTERLDGKRWQILAIKQRFINAFMKAKGAVRVIEGEAAADEQSDILESFSEAAGDPRILQRVKMQKKLESLQRKERMFAQGVADMRRTARNSESRVEQLNGRLKGMLEAGTEKNIQDLIDSQRQNFTATIDGITYDKRADAIAALADFAEEKMRVGEKSRQVGTYGGHPLMMEWGNFSDTPITTIDAFGEKASGKGIAGAEAKLRNFFGQVAEMTQERDRAKVTADNMAKAMNQPFGQAADLDRITKNLADLEQDLAMNPVPPPAWLRQGAPIDSEVFRKGRQFIVTGHRYGEDGWFVIAEDEKGSTLIPYLEATDGSGMRVYEEREFVAPEVMTKAGKDELTEADKVPESTPNYRANSKPAKGIPLFSAKAIAKKLRDSSGLNVVAVDNEQALPADLQAQIKRDGMGELVAGVYHNGTSYLIASNLQDAQHAIRTVLHEAVGHGGVKAVLGSNIAPVMRSIYSGMPAAMRNELERRYAGQTASLSAADAQALIAEEYVAHLAEHDPSNSVLDRVVALVRKFIRELFGAEAAGKWSRGDIVQLLAEAKRAAATGKGPDGSRYRESSAAEALAALPDVSEADEAEFVASLGDGQARAFAGALYKARGTESPFFKSWFGKSRMIDKQGQPITFVHRSYGERDSFTDSDLGKNTGTPTAALGHYLARKDVGNVERYGPVVERFYIRMAKPKVVTQDQFQAMGDWTLAQVKAYRETLVGQGFDGMYVQGLAWPIVFEGKNIKAVRNAGTFDETASTRYSLVTRQPFNIDRKAIAGKIAGKLTDWKPAALGALPLQYLRDFAPKGMTALGQYIEEKRQMDADRNEMHTRYDAIAQRWLKLRWGNRKAEQALADLMHAATLAGIDPSKGWLERYHPEQRAEYNRMAMQFKALPAEHQAMFRDARDAYKAQIKSMEDVIEENIRKSSDYAKMRARRDRDADIQQANDELTGEAREEAIEKAEKRYYGRVVSAEEGRSAKVLLMRKKFESMRVDEPYFPLKRFGEYFVALRDGKDLVSFSMFESAAEMNEAAEQMRKTYPGLDVKVGRQSAKQELEGAVDPAFVVDLQELVSRLPNSKEVSDQIYQMYLNTMPDFSMRKGFIHRKKTAGFNRDALRTFSSSMFHSSYQIARMKHSLEMNELVEQIEDQGRAAADPVDGMTIANEMRKRHEWVMNPKGGSIAQHITSAAFVYQLGATPAAAFVNTTQTWMMGVPVLGTRFGSEAKALSALGKASKDFIQGRGHIEKKLAGEESAAFAEFLRMGLIDKTQAHDLAGVGETGVEYNPVRHKVMGYISWMFHNAERYNREVTVMAGYRMGREAGLSHEAAIKEAAELTWTIHFDYSSGNRARYMQSDTAKILLVFRQHSVNMLSRLVIDIRQAMKGESKQVKAEAKRRLAGMFAMFAIFAGAMGVPGMQAILMLLNAMDDDDDPWTAEDKIKRAVTEAVGEDMAKVFFNGVPGAVTGVSLTDRIGMGSLWFWSPGRELEGQDAYYYWMEQVLGAAPAMVGNAFTGLKMVSEGNVYRGVETMMPKAIKDVMRSGRYADEGLQTMGGDTIIDELGAWEVVSQAMGFTPAHVAEQYDRNSALKNAEQHVMRERRSLMNGYAMATRQGDTEKLQEIRAQIADFNSRYSSWKITGKTLMQSNRSSLNSDRRTVDGIVLNKKLEYLRDQQ